VSGANLSPQSAAVGASRMRRALCSIVVILALSPAAAAATPAPTEARFGISLIAVTPAGASNCDNLSSLDGHLFLACENAATSSGGGSSTIAEYTESGSLINDWSIHGEAAGIGSDALNHRVIVTVNSNADSHLVTITPSAPPGQQVTTYRYSPGAPDSTASTGAVHTGGGTGSVSVDSAGGVYVTASHSRARAGTAVFGVRLSPPAGPGDMGIAALTPTFLDNATAADANTGGSAMLSLREASSEAIVPYASPLYAGSLVVDDFGARTLVFASNINAGTGLTALQTPRALTTVRWSAAANGALYILDKGAPAAGGSAIYEVTGPFVPGVAFASIGDQVVMVNLSTGALTPFVRNLTLATSLVYLDPSGTETPLAVAPLTTGTGLDAEAPTSGGNEDYTAVLLVLVFILLAIGGSYELSRRRQQAG
jgi:hypothetical protein